MAPQLGAPSYCSCREGRQSHWLSCPNKIFIVRLCTLDHDMVLTYHGVAHSKSKTK